MLKLPASRPAMTARTMACASWDDAPAMPMIRLTLATRPSVARNTVGRRTLEPRVSWGLDGAATRARSRDRMAFTAKREPLRPLSWRESPMPRRVRAGAARVSAPRRTLSERTGDDAYHPGVDYLRSTGQSKDRGTHRTVPQ